MSSNKAAQNERLAALRLYRTERVGPVTYRQLLKQYNSATAALEAIPELARKGGARALPKIPSASSIAQELGRLEKPGGRLLLEKEADFPDHLRRAENCPPLLLCLGDTALLSRPTIALVGARNASPNGARLAMKMASELGAADFVVVSGLARGIDGAAHQGALRTGTIAVLAGGVDQIYPPEHKQLYHEISQVGLLVSDMPLGSEPSARLFPRRNRIIAALSQAVVLIEAKLQSGTLITAQYALDYGRQIFAVPAAPYDPRAGGCNQWIRDGATLVRSARDIIEDFENSSVAEIQPSLFRSPSEERDFMSSPDNASFDAQSLDQARGQIHRMLSIEPIKIDELLMQCQLPAQLVLAVLMELELAGRLDRIIGGRVALVAEFDDL